MLAALTAAGLLMRNAGATKNALAGVMNASAVLIFLFSPEVRWLQAGIASVGAIAGGIMGGLLLHKLNERILRMAIVPDRHSLDDRTFHPLTCSPRPQYLVSNSGAYPKG